MDTKSEIETKDLEISRQKKNISEEILKRNNIKLNPFYKRINSDYFNKISMMIRFHFTNSFILKNKRKIKNWLKDTVVNEKKRLR